MRKLLRSILCLACFIIPLATQAQNQTVTGKVTDVTGNPLPGASIMVQKSRQAAVTNTEGLFELNVPEGTKITVNFTGFKSKTVTAGSSNPLLVVLEEDIAKLDEVVVTGLATTVKRRNAANAVATVSAKELTGVSPAQTFDVALSGKIVGANISANSGAPGGGLSIKLRGLSSIFGTVQPLFVIDGVIVSNRATSTGANEISQAGGSNSATSTQDNAASRIADINPNDIENVEILKGASASAIYGSQASAGVVIITTKKGRAGKTNLNVTQDVGFITVQRLIGASHDMTDEELTIRRWSIDRYKAAKASGNLYDYEKEVFGNTGFARNTSLSISGGSDKTTVHFSGGTRDEEGIVKNTGYQNNSLRLNVNHRASDRIKLGFSSAYMNTSSDRGLFNNDNKTVSVGMVLPGIRPYIELHPDEAGNYAPRSGSNLLQNIDLIVNNEKVNRVITGANAEIILQQSPISQTRFSARGGVDFFSQKSSFLTPAILTFEVNNGTGGRHVQGNALDLNTSWAGFLINTLTPGAGTVALTTTAGLTHEYGNYDQLLTVASNLVGSQTSQGQAANMKAQQTRQSYRNDGIFLQEEVAINEFLNFTAGVRFDKSTNNGDYKKYNVYPKANAAWNISKMPGWSSSVLNDLKLRIAYGESSGFPLFSSRFTTLSGHSIGGLPGSLISTTLGDPNIKSERQTELEGGIDVSILNGAVSLEITAYNKVIKDLLVASDYAPSSGFANTWINGGSLRNRGLELGLRATPVNSKNIRWNANVNFWLNRSKMLTLDVPAFDQGDAFGAGFGTFFIEEGQPVTQIKVNNEDGVAEYAGNFEPDYQTSIFNEVTLFRDLSFRMLMHWKKGGKNINLTQYLWDAAGTTKDYADDDGKGGHVGPTRAETPGGYVQDASYFRIREIALYYRLPLKVKGIQNVRIGASANNYFTWTKYTGYDPEVANFGTGFSSGLDVAPYPSSKRLQFHLSLDF